MKQSTSKLILDTARKLFNEKGSSAITTNHIAKECSMSPGNLYYHYRNKEHIFRDLLSQMIVEFDEISFSTMDVDNIAENHYIKKTCQIMYDYQFIYSDLSYIISYDDGFRKMYASIKEKRKNDFEYIISFFSDKGFLKDIPAKNELDKFIDIIWTYVEGIVTSLKIEGKKVSKSNIEKSFMSIFILLKPFLAQ